MQFDRFRRRDVIGLLGGAALLWPLSALAQQQRRSMRIGALIGSPPSDPEVVSRLATFRQAIKDLGWVEGENLHIEYRWSADDPKQARAYAAEIVALRPNVIFAGGTSIAVTVQRETSSLPIVFTQVADPVGAGLVDSFARPGRNATGFSHFEFPFAAKWVELLKEIAPQLSRVAVIYDPSNPASAGYLPVVERVARQLMMESRPFAVRSAAEIESTVGAFAREPHGGLILIPGPIMGAQRKLLVGLARAHRLPSIYGFRYHPAEGGLMSYGVDLNDLYRRAASYLDRILKGEKPADLPVQAPTKFDLVINLATAKALAIPVPASVLARADEVIE